MKTVFLGDSLTAGMPGVSYWRFLHNKSKLVNKGVGGDTLQGAINRAEGLLSNPKYDDVEQYIIEIGTNDVLLPFVKKHSFIWRMIEKIGGKVFSWETCKDTETFRVKYEALIQKLIQRNKKIGVIGLPMIENNILIINDIMKDYDAVIVELCRKYDIAYLDARQLQAEIKGDNHGTYYFDKPIMGDVTDTLLTSILPFSMLVSKSRGLAVTVDSIHMNSKAAKVLAEAVEKKFL